MARLSRRGKVRDLYDVGDALLLVASDRISAFDCVLQPGVPDKGKILTQLSNFWFAKFSDVENHLLETEVERFPEELRPAAEQLAGRSVLVRKAEVVPFECVARGYLAGSGWAEYRKTGEVCGIRLPPGLVEAERLPEPIFTPATKNEKGHDENVSFADMANAIGTEEAQWLRDNDTLPLYARARDDGRVAGAAAGRHEARVRPLRRPADLDRRGLHARTPRATGTRRSTGPARSPVVLRQAVRPRLARVDRLEQAAARAAAAGGGHPHDPGKVPRRLSPSDRLAAAARHALGAERPGG